jgi:hypothetical protein
MSNRKATFQILSEYNTGDQFSGYTLKMLVKAKTGKELFPATALRYLRIWRMNNKKIVCINKSRSLYRIIEA